MLLKNAVIHEVSNLLNEIKITKIADKEIKLKLMHNYLVLRKASNTAMEDIRAIADKFRDDWGKTLYEVNALRKDGEEIDNKKYKDYLSAEKDANESIMAINTGETDVDIEPMESDAFVSAIGEDEVTLSTIGYLVDNGILT